MARPKTAATPATADTVDGFLATLDHPQKPLILAMRDTLLTLSPTVRESIKWNAPNFATATTDFATFHLRAKDGVKLVLHTGATVKANATTGIAIDDPAKLLAWPAKDRAVITLTSLDDFNAKKDAFVTLLRTWIALLP